jgi:hypothetical protein
MFGAIGLAVLSGLGRRYSLAFRDTLLETVGLASLGMDWMMLFFSCDIF